MLSLNNFIILSSSFYNLILNLYDLVHFDPKQYDPSARKNPSKYAFSSELISLKKLSFT